MSENHLVFKLPKSINYQKKLDPQSELLLKETLGHSKTEVMVGSLLGPLITLPGMFFLGSPIKIFDLIIS